MALSSRIFLWTVTTILLLTSNLTALERIYSVTPKLNVRAAPSTKSSIIAKLSLGKWVTVLSETRKWKKVRLHNGKTGFVNRAYAAKTWIKVWKKEHRLLLMENETILKHFPIALGSNPDTDKVKQGDGSTPNGRFFISKKFTHTSDKRKYGIKSLLLSYPNKEDARRGLKDRIILRDHYMQIVRAVDDGRTPLQNTRLGGDIRIQGGGIGTDWTTGAIAMKDKDIKELMTLIPKSNTLVEIYPSMLEDKEFNQKGAMNKRILEAAGVLLQSGCMYTKAAKKVIRIGFPMGDFDPKIGISTDVIIRTLRKTGIDLQALIYEDIILNRKRYGHIKRLNRHIDHRRTQNIKIFLDHHAQIIKEGEKPFDPLVWLPGDIVIMDTNIENGTQYDHIGIISDTIINGRPLVINLWGEGYTIGEMDLFKEEGAIPVAHYRMLNHLNY